MRLLSLALVLVLGASAGRADDGAASIAAGGLVLMKREPRIVMAKEVLRIGLDKVVVDYEFRNDSDQDITTVVAFPIPAYGFGDDQTVFGDPAFRDFRLSVEGKAAHFQIEARALVGKQDVTALLAREHVGLLSFGGLRDKQPDYSAVAPDFQRLGHAEQQRLIAAGAFDGRGQPQWKVAKKYYWTQMFSAGQVVHIEHRYTPVLGGTNSVRYGLEAEKSTARPDADTRYLIGEIDSLCLEPPLKEKLLKLSARNDMSVPFNYVDFILTTANTWKTPIEDFTLIVDRPAAAKPTSSKTAATRRKNETLVSFCWNGPIEKPDSEHFVAHTKDFIPGKELRIGFVQVEPQDSSSH